MVSLKIVRKNFGFQLVVNWREFVMFPESYEIEPSRGRTEFPMKICRKTKIEQKSDCMFNQLKNLKYVDYKSPKQI